MKNAFTLIFALCGVSAFGQAIEQNIKKQAGQASHLIKNIDSIRFDAALGNMEVVLKDGTAESHGVAVIELVSFSEREAAVVALDCKNPTFMNSIMEGLPVDDDTVKVDYTGGNGGAYPQQIISSSGATGLTLALPAGQLDEGSGLLSFILSGSAATTGVAKFDLDIAGVRCVLELDVVKNPYPAHYVHCGKPTAVVEVVSTTGRVWMDRNLGAAQVATHQWDSLSFGDLYQWGRGPDGHQCKNSAVVTNKSTGDQPGHGFFINPTKQFYEWQEQPNVNLWKGVGAVNNPCPNGYRVPTMAELDEERKSWSVNSPLGAMNSPLKLPMAGHRSWDGKRFDKDGMGYYYSDGNYNGNDGGFLTFGTLGIANMGGNYRANANSIRCIKN